MDEPTGDQGYRFEVVCQLLRLSPATLRRYERHGLVSPQRSGRASLYSALSCAACAGSGG